MKKRETNPGKWYAVTSASGCTVSFETKGGTVTLEMKAPQDVFCAVGGSVSISDDSATLTQTFNLAPSFFKAARGWGQDPIWFQSLHAVLTRLLDGTQFEMVLTEQGSKLIVHTSRSDDTQMEAVTEHLARVLPKDIVVDLYNSQADFALTKYAACKTSGEMDKIAYYPNDLTSDKEWLYPLNELVNADRLFMYKTHIKKVALYTPKATSFNDALSGVTALETLDIYAPNAQSVKYMCNDCYNLRKVTGNLSKVVEGYEMCKNTVVEIFECDLPSLSNGYRMFNNISSNLDVGGRLNKASTLRVLRSIPAYTSGTHRLGIGIHIDHQTDEEVLAAIANAESKGWTLTVQWNGTPTAAASVMSFGQLIYAKVSEHERPDGTTERVLDWGHYVTDETGYETFRSRESAYEYFGLPMPEEESQPTE